MKRITNRRKYLRRQRKRERRILADRLRRASFLNRRNNANRGIGTSAPPPATTFRAPPWVNTVHAPKVLSLLRNADEIAKFVSELKNDFDRQRSVFVDLQGVREVDYDGLTVLLSVLVRFKAKKIPFNGNYPRDMSARRILNDSGFFRHLFSRPFEDQRSYELVSERSIVTHANMIVDSHLGAEIVAEASETVWGERRRCPGVQRALIELMHNTNNHASGDKQGDKHWWLSVKHFKEQHRVTFSFLDFGVGVFKSLHTKPEGHRFYGVLQKLRDRVRYGNDAEVMRLIFEGELHRTATGKYYRGKGLPGIYAALTKNEFSNLAMITNRVFFDSATQSYRTLANEFQGTFVHWELRRTNHSLPQ